MNEFSAPLFASLAPALIGVGVALPFLARRYDGYWILGALALVVAYAVSRTVSIPALGLPEPVESLGVFSKVLEVSFVLVTLANMRKAPVPEGSRDRDASSPASAAHAD